MTEIDVSLSEEVKDKLVNMLVMSNYRSNGATRNLNNLPGYTHQGMRDNWRIFGYKKTLQYSDYRLEYDRGLGGRIVDKWVSSTWQKPPQISEEGETDTDFVKDVEQLVKDFDLWDLLNKADKQASIGEFSILLLGLNDAVIDDIGNVVISPDLSNPPNTSGLNGGLEDLLFIRSYSQGDIASIMVDSNPNSKRFGLPEYYVVSPSAESLSSGTTINFSNSETFKVHHTRVVHIADNTLDNSFIGTPKMQRSMNVLQDILKTVGGSAEDYWRIGDRGMTANVQSDVVLTPEQKADIKDQIDDYINGKRRFITMQNTDVSELGGRDVDPSGMFSTLEKVLAGTSDIPNRIFFGSERGQLASGQDAKEWAATITNRQLSFANDIIKDLLNKLLEYNILSPLKYGNYDIGTPDEKGVFVWPSIIESDPVEQSTININNANANAVKIQSFVSLRTEGLDPYNAAKQALFSEEEALLIADKILNNPIEQ